MPTRDHRGAHLLPKRVDLLLRDLAAAHVVARGSIRLFLGFTRVLEELRHRHAVADRQELLAVTRIQTSRVDARSLYLLNQVIMGYLLRGAEPVARVVQVLKVGQATRVDRPAGAQLAVIGRVLTSALLPVARCDDRRHRM